MPAPSATSAGRWPSQRHPVPEVLPQWPPLLLPNSSALIDTLAERGQAADANIPDLMDGVEYDAVSRHMGSGMFMGESHNMTQGWKGKQIVSPELFGEINSSRQGFSDGG